MSRSELPVVCLMGPTASGKTDIAIRLAELMPSSIISVDSALVYRGLDIGAAKADADTLARVPHKLIDIRDPEENYSAGEFVIDAQREIDAAHQSGRLPILAGGTMLYFRSLTEGMADMPSANADVRERIDGIAMAEGWPAMHARLAEIDPVAAERINANDSQRIQRALEVYEVSGRTLSAWHADEKREVPAYRYLKAALIPQDRAVLHGRIEQRLTQMIAGGFVDEVRRLRQRPGLTAAHSSMRSVGYRQVWQHLDGDFDLETATFKALVATRQLAKRQLTWLRSESELLVIDPLEPDAFGAISTAVLKQMDV
jgi:tRNA dimethylallyltransferase